MKQTRREFLKVIGAGALVGMVSTGMRFIPDKKDMHDIEGDLKSGKMCVFKECISDLTGEVAMARWYPGAPAPHGWSWF